VSAGVVIATVDAIHAEVIREALEAAGIDARIVEIRPFRQLEYFRHQRPAQVDVQVTAADAPSARAVLDRLQLEMQEAMRAETPAEEHARKSLDDLRLEREHARTTPAPSVVDEAPRSPWVAALLSIIPFAAPIYVSGPAIILSMLAHLGGFVLLTLLCLDPYFREPSGATLPELLGGYFVATRIVDFALAETALLVRHLRSHGDE
jgi:hypothetical protein